MQKISQRKSILRKNSRCFLCLEKGQIMENCSINYQCSKCKGKYHITICEGPRKLDTNTNKDSKLAPIIQDGETLTTLNESRHSYKELTQKFLTMNFLTIFEQHCPNYV